VKEVIVHISKEEKARDLVSISGEIAISGVGIRHSIIQTIKISRYDPNIFLSFV
jgi:hypothetical protein